MIPSGSADDWEALLWRLMAMDNAQRNGAEAELAARKAASADATLSGLLQVVHSPRSDDVRGLATVLLRRVLLRDAVSLWPLASDAVQTLVKTQLLQVLCQEQNRSIRRKVCDTVGELAGSILEDGQWEELLPTLLQWLEAPQVTLRETTMRVFEMIAIYLAAMLEQSDGDQQAHFEQVVLQTLSRALSDPHGRVAVNAVRALSMLLLQLEPASLEALQRPELLEDTLPRVLRVLHRLVQDQQFDAVMELLEVLIEVAEPHAAYFQPLLGELVAALVQMADASSSASSSSGPATPTPDGCRQLAMELLVSLAENGASACRRLPRNAFVSSVFPVTFQLMLELDDLESWSPRTCEADDDDVTREISNFDVGSEALERLVGALGAAKSLPTCFSLIHAFAARQDSWLHRHAALVALCQVLDALEFTQLEQVTTHLLAQVYDPHPRVCCTAIDVLGQLAMDQAPRFQEVYHAQVLAVLLHYLVASDQPRLQAHAATALRQFIDMCSRDLLEPYLDKLLHQLFDVLRQASDASKLPHQLQQQQQPQQQEASASASTSGSDDSLAVAAAAHVVVEQTITVLSSVATVAGRSFARYYSAVMPTLQNVLLSCMHETTTLPTTTATTTQAGTTSSSSTPPPASTRPFTLGGITLECISLIAVAVGRDVFAAADARAVMSLMVEMQTTPRIVENERIRTYLLQAWARLATCLGTEFAQYLPVVMPTLLQAATQQAEFDVDPSALRDSDSDSDSGMSSLHHDDEDEDVQLAQVNDRTVSIRTSVLEEKATACELLASLARDLEAAFFPYAEQVTQVLAPLMTDSVHTEIRAASIAAMAALVRCVALATPPVPQLSSSSASSASSVSSSLVADGAEPPESVKQMLDFALGRLVHALTSEPDLELVVSVMQTMKQCLEAAQQVHRSVALNGAQLSELVQALLLVLGDSFQRRALRRQKRARATVDAHESLEDEDEDVEEEEEEDDEEDDHGSTQEARQLEQELQFVMADVVGHLAKAHGAAFFPVFQALLWDKLVELSAAHCLPEDRKLALYILDDVLEHCGPPAMAQIDAVLPLLIEVVLTSDGYPPVLQASAYGMGLCASHGGALFTPHAASALQVLLEVVSLPHAQHEESGMRNACDNAVSAIGLICEHHANAVDAAALFPRWLSLLPLRGDLEESVAVLKRLCRLVLAQNRLLLGVSQSASEQLEMQHAAAVVRVFADTLVHARTFERAVGDDAFAELRAGMAQALAALRTWVPSEAMTQAWTELTPPQQGAVHALFSS